MQAAEYPWDRQPRETPKAWAAFCTYRGLGVHERSFRAVAESIPSEKSKTGHREVSVVKNWAHKYNWVARVNAFDSEMQRLGLVEQEQAIKDMYARYARTGADLFRKIAQRIEGDEEEGVAALDPSVFTPADLRTLGELAIKFETLRANEEKDKQQNPNRPIEVTLAFNSTPRFPDDHAVTALPSPVRELEPVIEGEIVESGPEFPEAA